MKVAEFAGCKQWWGGDLRTGRIENEQAWKVSIEAIKASNYNLDIKNPHQVEIDHGDPDELLADYQTLQGEIANTLDQLKAELEKALTEAQQ